MQRFRLRRVRVTPALVISMIALFVALSSTGFAATIVPLAKRPDYDYAFATVGIGTSNLALHSVAKPRVKKKPGR